MWEDIEAYAEIGESEISPRGPFIGAKYEENKGYDIAWFVWERDGIVPQSIIPQDWEPIILYWKGKKLEAVEGRPHFGWKMYYTNRPGEPNCTLNPIKVIFATSHHTPRIRNTIDDTFDRVLSSYQKLDYQFEPVLSEEVPDFARKPIISRTGILPWMGEDIHSHVRKMMKILY